MVQEGCVLIGKFETTFIFRAEGRLTQKSLWTMNTAVQKCLEDQTVTDLLVDITNCLYMDSTILGILARWAISFAKTHPLPPFLIGLHENPLENIFKRMNLNTLFHISQEPHLHEETALSQLALAQQHTTQEYAEYVLSAHQTLAELSPENAKEFAAVIQVLKAELEAK